MCTPDLGVNAWARQTVPSARRGVTLIELLVVISIMLLLMLMAIPMVRLMAARRPIREAARAVSDYFAAAQVRARETGRPAGVWIERFSNQPQSAFTLYQAEVPPPYGGETIDTQALVRLTTGPDANYSYYTAAINVAPNCSLIHVGDSFQLNFQGPWYTIDGPDTNADGIIDTGTTTLILKLLISSGISVPWTSTNTQSFPFQILRQPMRTAAKPLQLPGSTVIDLYGSGTSGTAGMAFEPLKPDNNTAPPPVYHNTDDPVIIMFAPNGSLDSVYCLDTRPGPTFLQRVSFIPTEPVHLLIGRRDRMLQVVPDLSASPDPPPGDSLAEDRLRNWEDLNNLWVSVFPRNGLVTVAEMADAVSMAKNDPACTWPYASTTRYDSRDNRRLGFGYARTYANQGQSLGGR